MQMNERASLLAFQLVLLRRCEWGQIFVVIAALSTGIAMTSGHAQEAAGEIRSTTAAPSVKLPPPAAKARVVVDDLASGALFEKVIIGRGKAAVIELPVDARDILVSDPQIADARVRTPRQIYIIGTAVGITSALFFDEQGKQILNLEITVSLDISAAAASLAMHFPDNKLTVEGLGGNLTVSGRVPNLAAANRAISIVRRFVEADENIVNLLTIEGDEQVLLKVRVAEMRRTITKQLGINLLGNFNRGGGSGFQANTSNQFSIAGRLLGGLTAGANKTVPGPTVPPLSSTPALSLTTNSLTGVLQALERDGLVHVLAEPNLTAVSGEAAKFLAGGEFPVPTGRDRDGNIIITFKQFGVGLGFTPVVLSDGRISLRMSTEVSQVSNEQAVTLVGLVIPGLSVRRAETTVELPSGGSLVIGGLLQDDIRKAVDGIPGLKDIPILGSLFRSSDFQSNETELVIIVTPYLVKPVNEDELRLPTDGFAPASDFDDFILGRMSGVYKRNAEAGASLQGPYGFIME